MWHDMFHLAPTIGEKVLRPLLVYGFLLVGLRLGGNREMSQLNVMDFIVLLAIANAVQNGIIGVDDSVTGAFIGAAVLMMVNVVAGNLTRRSRRARQVLVGTPVVLVRNGVVNADALRRERLSLDDLREQLVAQGAENESDVALCVLEPNGQFVVRLEPNHELESRLDDVAARLERIEAAIRRG